MPISLATPPTTRLLSTVARVNARLGISGVDALVATLLAVSSEEIVRALGYDIVRAEIVDTFEGEGWTDRIVRWAPLLSLEEVTFEGSAVALSQFEIADAAASLVRAESGWYEGGPWSLRAWAGWLTPADDLTSAAITFSASGKTLTLSAGTWPLLIAGDTFTVSGSDGGTNDGTYTIASRTDTVLTVVESVTDEAEGESITVACSNLPEDIEMAAIMRVRDLRTAATSTRGDLTSVTLGSLKFSFASTRTAKETRTAMDQMVETRRRVAM